MPQALVPIIGSLLGTSLLVSNIIAYGISALFTSLLAPDSPEQEATGPLINKRSNTSSIPVIYGTRRAGGNIVFVDSSGGNGKFLHVILLVSEGEVEGFENIYIDDKELRWNSNNNDFVLDSDGNRLYLKEEVGHSPTGAVELDEYGEDEDTGLFKGLVSIHTHHGSDDQIADASLVSEIGGWTTSHRLRGRSYIYAKFTYDQDTFGGIPNITTDIKGKKVAPIDTSTMTIDDTASNAIYSNNPALCLRDYLVNKDYGRGLDPVTIDDKAFISAAMYCDEEIVLLNEGGTEVSRGKRYTLDGLLQTSSTLYENTQSILTHMRGFLVFSSGLYRLVLDRPEVSSVLYDESNIIGPLKVNLGTKKNTLNRMRVTFWNPNKEGDNDTILVDAREVRDILDNGTVLSRDIRLPFCNNPHTARYIANQEIEQSRQQITISFTVGIAGLRNDIGDIIRVQHGQMGWGYHFSLIDNEIVQLKNTKFTIRNIGETSLFNTWNSTVDYSTNNIVSENGVLFKALSDPSVGASPNNAAKCSTNPSSTWCEIDEFTQIPNLEAFGIFNFNGETVTVADNKGLNGEFLYKEFRILSLSLEENEEVSITAVEYDATVFDNYPISLIDATPNTSFRNPNRVPAPSGLSTFEDLYVTSNSGGVKAALSLNWVASNSAFVTAYDIFVHAPEQKYSEDKDYRAGDKVSVGTRRYEAILANGPSSSVTEPTPGSNSAWDQLTTLANDDFMFLTRTRTTSTVILDAVPGEYAVRIKAVSVTGVSSSALEASNIFVAGLVAPPSNVTGFGSTPQGDLALLQWNVVDDLDVRIGGNIQVRHTPETTLPTDDDALQQLWASSSLLTEGKSGVTTQILVPLQLGIYLIKAIDSSKIESLVPAAVLNSIQPSKGFNFLRKFAESPNWLGLTTDHDTSANSLGVEKYGTELRLSTTNPWDSTKTDYTQGTFVRLATTFYKALQAPAVNTSPSGSALCSTLIDTVATEYTSGTSLILSDTGGFGATGTGLIDGPAGSETFSWSANSSNTLTLTSALSNNYGVGSTVDVTSAGTWCKADSLGAFSASNATPVVTEGTYLLNTLISFKKKQKTQLRMDLVSTASDVDAFIDELPAIDTLDRIDGNTPTATVIAEISTANKVFTTADPLLETDFSGYTHFTSGEYDITAARFRIKVITDSPTTQVNIKKCDIIVDAIDISQSSNNLVWASDDTSLAVFYTDDDGASTPFFNDATLGSFAAPYVGITVDGIRPGEYFKITNNYNDSSESFCLNAGGSAYDSSTGVCTIADNDTSAPHPWEGFKIAFKKVGVGTIPNIGIVLLAPDADNDGAISRAITFDYRATGF